MNTRDKNLAEQAEAYFGPLYGRELTDSEAAEIVENLRAFAEILIEMYEREQAQVKGSSSLSSESSSQ